MLVHKHECIYICSGKQCTENPLSNINRHSRSYFPESGIRTLKFVLQNRYRYKKFSSFSFFFSLTCLCRCSASLPSLRMIHQRNKRGDLRVPLLFLTNFPSASFLVVLVMLASACACTRIEARVRSVCVRTRLCLCALTEVPPCVLLESANLLCGLKLPKQRREAPIVDAVNIEKMVFRKRIKSTSPCEGKYGEE